MDITGATSVIAGFIFMSLSQLLSGLTPYNIIPGLIHSLKFWYFLKYLITPAELKILNSAFVFFTISWKRSICFCEKLS